MRPECDHRSPVMLRLLAWRTDLDGELLGQVVGHRTKHVVLKQLPIEQFVVAQRDAD
jgi:hypothetical protein